LIGIRSLDSSNNPKIRRVYSLMFIVDIEEKKKKNIKVNNKKIKITFIQRNNCHLLFPITKDDSICLLATLFIVYNYLSPKKYINRMFHKKLSALGQK
jgi:hypothetical protein